MKFAVRIPVFSILLVVLLYGSQGQCQDDAETDAGEVEHSRNQNAEKEMNIGARIVSIFRDHISKVDGDRCPSIPTCSSYSVQAFEKHGFIKGYLMTVDRLIHEIDESKVSPVVYHEGRAKVLDPVENNDFWWYFSDDASKK